MWLDIDFEEAMIGRLDDLDLAIKSLQTPRFIKLTHISSGEESIINIDQIACFRSYRSTDNDSIAARVRTVDGHSFFVKETPEQIMAMINGEAVL